MWKSKDAMHKKIILSCLLATSCFKPVQAKAPGYVISHIAAIMQAFFLQNPHCKFCTPFSLQDIPYSPEMHLAARLGYFNNKPKQYSLSKLP